MKRFLLFHSETGAGVQTVSASQAEVAQLATTLGAEYIEVAGGVGDSTHFVVDGAAVPFPPAPSPVHTWDWGARAWQVSVDAIDGIKARRAMEINAIRDARQYLPVLYDGVLFDSDPQSRTAITGLEARIRRGDGLTAPWFGWRAYDNQFVWADATAEQVLSHLLNLQRLLEDRWQALLNRSWVLKDTLLTLSGADDVLGFDVQAGWPD